MAKTPIVVLTPVKNEAWILERFLKVTERFADAIIIADQFSTDDTVVIASKFSKVHLIINDRIEYDEEYRQILLIQKARELYPGKKCLLALDADEIMTASSMEATFWNDIDTIEPGTVLCFEKPDVIFPIEKCIRHDSFFYIGYIDDGVPHTGKKIHSVRIPKKSDSAILNITEVKFMHYALTRKIEYRSRQRYYSIIENVKNVAPFYRRLLSYSPRLNEYVTQFVKSDTPESWLKGWEDLGIDMRSIQSSELNNFNFQVLENLEKYGPSKFYLDDIWDLDWVSFSRNYNIQNSKKIKNIPLLRKILLDIIVFGLKIIKRVKSN